MDKLDTMTRFLGIVVLASSSIAAFCVSLMGYTFATGELPFGMHPLFALKEDGGTGSSHGPGDAARSRAREGESFAVKLYGEMAAERERLSVEAARIADQRRALDEMAATATKLQEEAEKKTAMLQNQFVTIDVQERENARRVAGLLAETDSKDGAKMLLQMEEKSAAQVIFYMAPKLSGPLLSAMLKSSDPESTKKAAHIMEIVRRLTEKESS